MTAWSCKTWTFCGKFLLFWKKRPLSNCRYCADRAQICQASPHIWLTLFKISSKSVHFRRSYCRVRENRFCPIEYLQYRLFEPIMQRKSFKQIYIVACKSPIVNLAVNRVYPDKIFLSLPWLLVSCVTFCWHVIVIFPNISRFSRQVVNLNKEQRLNNWDFPTGIVCPHHPLGVQAYDSQQKQEVGVNRHITQCTGSQHNGCQRHLVEPRGSERPALILSTVCRFVQKTKQKSRC